MNLEAARRQMIEQQVRAWDVLDGRVLAALHDVPREEFAPPQYRGIAFADLEVPLPHGQCMLAPKVEGRILQALLPQPDDTVLEIGTGSGFFAACLGLLARSVRSLEIFPDLAASARACLRAARATNVTVEDDDAMRIALPEAAFDAIAVTGSLPVYDARFERALAVGGRLFVVVGQAPLMEARLITRRGPGDWLHESLFETVVPPLLHAAEPPKFVF